jgi:hypothetical protein
MSRLLAVLLLASACSESTADLLHATGRDSGVDSGAGRIVGGPCAGGSDCDPASRCLGGEKFPGGTCSRSCKTGADCPPGAACVESEEGVCLLSCASSAACRSGYLCTKKGRREGGETLVCVAD